MTDRQRLIEVAFPLRQASLDSVHEKNVRHGHISTLHIWPARRPLAACRAALIATLLPDPGNDEARKELLRKLGGDVVRRVEKDRVREETEGGVLHWGREGSADMDWFREEIRKAYGGRAPRVLDPFAGGGAIPLEAMRLGCDVTAVDINPVAWFILKCTLEYPQKLAGQTRPLPKFALGSRSFMEAYLKGTGLKGKRLKKELELVQQHLFPPADADLAWHVRAWGEWVLNQARRELARFYPVYADFEPLEPGKPYERRQMRQVLLKEDGTANVDALNKGFTAEYLDNAKNPRWVAKPTVAYLWARTVKCKNCRATIPLLKTRWLCKKANRRVLLTMKPNPEKKGVVFGVQENVPVVGGNKEQRKQHDKKIGAGTISKSGATCPCCQLPSMKVEDIRLEGQAQHLDYMMTVVVVDGEQGKEFRLPTPEEQRRANEASSELDRLFTENNIPFGMIDESTPAGGGSGAGRAFSVQGYGLMRWRQLFTDRQLLALGTVVKYTRAASGAMLKEGYPTTWIEGIATYLACGVDRLVDFCNVNTQWKTDVPTINHALVRFAIQITWDFAEGNPIGNLAGSYRLCLNRVAIGLETVLRVPRQPSELHITRASATAPLRNADIIVTDPPYYDAIPYSDLMDWFYVWLRRTVWDLSPEFKTVMEHQPLGPKWTADGEDAELIDDPSRHKGDAVASKKAYEDGMVRAFSRCAQALTAEGRLVIVFANKNPDAWETLVLSVIRAGFIVTGSWPIQTEQPSRSRGQSSAALASSVWLVCKKRSPSARPGWDNAVLDEMRTNIHRQLRRFWDDGIRGPDFVWSATGPALEAYSKHPVVKKADKQGELMTVAEFLGNVRHIVVDFVVGRVLTRNGDAADTTGLDNLTTYYLLHRHAFGLAKAPAGACILYAVSCNLADPDLADRYDLLLRVGGQEEEEEDEEDTETDADGEPEETGSGSQVRLKPWAQRKRKGMGHDTDGRPVPLIDQAHRVMHLWKGGDVARVNEYLDQRGLRRNVLFHQLVQSLIELSRRDDEDECSLLEKISNHLTARGPDRPPEPEMFKDGPFAGDES